MWKARMKLGSCVLFPTRIILLGCPIDPTLLIGLHWAPIGSARYMFIPNSYQSLNRSDSMI